MNRTTAVLGLLLVASAAQAADSEVGRTSLANPDVKYTVPDNGYHVLKRGDVRAVIVDNRAVDDHVLFGHRAGYSGVASLTHATQDANLFVPPYAGLNYEHIHDGTTQHRDILFEPRRAPMELRVVNEHTAELYQAPTPTWKLESVLRYEMLEDGTIEMTLECIPRAKTFRNGYIGLFWASYIHQPESLDIHFKGREEGLKLGPHWIRGVTPKHGVSSTHPGHGDRRKFKHDDDFPLTLVFNRSKYRYAEPWYYAVSHGMAFVQMFRPQDKIWLSQSPSGGGKGNPAWDFQFMIPDYEVGRRYQMVMRAQYVPFESTEQIEKASLNHRRALGHRGAIKETALRTLRESEAKVIQNEVGNVTSISFARRSVTTSLLQHLAGFPRLEDVSLYETAVTDEQFAILRDCGTLKRLNLGFCQRLTDRGVQHVLSLKRLEFLNLGFCRNVTGAMFQRISELPRLKTLNLSVTSLSDDDLSGILQLRNLETLDIDNTRVTDVGITQLAGMKTLRSLRLVGVRVTDAGLEKLTALPRLRHIYLRDTSVSADGVKVFQAARPQCLVKQ